MRSLGPDHAQTSRLRRFGVGLGLVALVSHVRLAIAQTAAVTQTQPGAEQSSAQSSITTAATTALAWSTGGVSREEFSAARRELDAIVRAGAERIGASTPGLAVKPMWCRIGGRNIVSLLALSIGDGTTVAQVATSPDVPTTFGRGAPQIGETGRRIAGVAGDLFDALSEKLAETSRRETSSLLTVRLSTGPGATRGASEESLTCHQALATLALLESGVAVTQSIGAEALLQARRGLNITTQLRRGNRSLVISWPETLGENARATRWPLQLRATARWTDAVFGQPFVSPVNDEGVTATTPRETTFTTSFDRAQNGRVSGSLPASVTATLTREATALTRNDLPQIARIDRGWAYLDRGRAWGLQMDDRVRARAADGSEVTGHVVGFYGPEARLKSPRGFPINEGAIVFVRKGQGLIDAGLQFDFDPQTYPTDALAAPTAER